MDGFCTKGIKSIIWSSHRPPPCRKPSEMLHPALWPWPRAVREFPRSPLQPHGQYDPFSRELTRKEGRTDHPTVNPHLLETLLLTWTSISSKVAFTKGTSFHSFQKKKKKTQNTSLLFLHSYKNCNLSVSQPTCRQPHWQLCIWTSISPGRAMKRGSFLPSLSPGSHLLSRES